MSLSKQVPVWNTKTSPGRAPSEVRGRTREITSRDGRNQLEGNSKVILEGL